MPVETEEIISVNKDAARRKARRAGKRVAGFVSEKVASQGHAARRKVEKVVSQGHAARRKVGQARRRAAGLVSKRISATGGSVGRRASKASKVAAAKILEAAIEISRKQQEVLEKLKTRL